jgi:hypothetical protein
VGCTYSLLELGNLLISQSISLGNDRDQVDLGVQTAHDLDVERLERVTSWLNEVDTGMNAVVHNVHSVDLVLGLKVCVESLLNVLHDWAPGVIIVDEVAEAGGVDDSQSESDAVLFDVGTDGLDGDGLWDDVEAGAFALTGRVERGVEESVDQGGLSEAGFAYNG